MNDTRTEWEKYQSWLAAILICAEKGWKNISGWIFKAPGGTIHDLSAADLTRLDYIELKGSFLVVDV